ncbi:MAG: ATP-binding cassette domain-containing protein [Eggerthellaceae bacterium]|jgi:ABC-2 type transport system ATP-binding protein|nr:ATP-binding cassette domain-containing protein [Eggerthellaceae bacterium]MCH4220639.1 ATP-binding cassette domain-containing protein [Eggerthellaceae bacterium]
MQVEVHHYLKRIKGITILNDISYSFSSGIVYGLQGKNGSGKTMLLRAIAGLIFPTSGYVSSNNKIIGKNISFPDSIGLLIEHPSFIGKYTGFKNLQILSELKGVINDDDVRQAIKDVGLDPSDKRHYRKYSLGMKQRLGVACAMMEHPDIILLDEPINALDPTGVECVEHLLAKARQRGSLIIIACHDNNELRVLADKILTLSEGKIISSEAVNHEDAC